VNPFYLPGPQFLLFYTIFAGVVICGAIFWRRRAELLPSTPRIDLSDPYLIAYLRGGEKEVALLRAYAPTNQMLGLVEACESYDKTLRRARLLPDEYVTCTRLVRLVIAGSLLGGVAVTKVLLALAAGRSNVGFLVLLTIAAIVIASMVSFPRLTDSGKAMLEDVKSLYSGLKDRSPFSKQGDAGFEPTMMAAVFGVGALSASGYVDQLFPRRGKKQDGSCATDSDCGSSCSSSSGSDSGTSSSCSSGSSCGGGGGCGGCGGGCGGS
jgi:uncharacterized membrane protein YgcG